MKKLVIIVIALFILNNCGYSPIYSLKNGNLYIKEISQKNRNKLESKVINKVEKFSNKDSKNIIDYSELEAKECTRANVNKKMRLGKGHDIPESNCFTNYIKENKYFIKYLESLF